MTGGLGDDSYSFFTRSPSDLGLATFPQPTNATKKPIDSSARKLLIYIGVKGVPSGLLAFLDRPGAERERRNGEKTHRLAAEVLGSEVRKSPQEPA